MRRLMLIAVFGLSACAELAVAVAYVGSGIREGPLPARGTEIGDRVPANCRSFYCGNIGFVDQGAAVDGPSYYFRRSDGRIVGSCGGSCWRESERCRRECPPPEWTCRGDLPRNAFAPNNQRR